jgi:3-methyladenine DNA glycosylase AlkD
MTQDLQKIRKKLRNLANPKKAKILQRFFKTAKGEYGEGDKFLGIVVPEQRKVAKDFHELALVDLQKLLNSSIHEERLIALFILVFQYQKAQKENDKKQKRIIFNFYLKNTKRINNWDLVDLSAPNIMGNYLLNKKRNILYKLAQSKNLWEKRIAVLATFEFIKNQEWIDTFTIVKILLQDEHDLIHKACGWMLRETGNKIGQQREESFLRKYYKKMPRTMLRYAIEKFPEKRRQQYLKNLV